MFHLYSKGCEHAIHAMICIGTHQGPKKLSAEKICRKEGIPVSFTRKYLQTLVHQNLLKSVPGVRGGYALARPAKEITVKSIIVAVEGEQTFTHCIMGLPECNEQVPCPLHHMWSSVKNNLLSVLASRTLQDLIEIIKVRANEKRNLQVSS